MAGIFFYYYFYVVIDLSNINLNINMYVRLYIASCNFFFSCTEIIFLVPGIRQKCCQIFHHYIPEIFSERLRAASYSCECPVFVLSWIGLLLRACAYECEILIYFFWKCLMPETLKAQIEEVSEAALIERIQMRKVKAAVDLYDQLLQAGKIEPDEALNVMQ